MKKSDYLLFALLLALLFTWPVIDREIIKKRIFHETAQPVATATETEAPPAATTTTPAEAAPAATPAEITAQPAPATPAPAVEEESAATEEKTATASNGKMSITFSSRGASIKDVTLNDYRAVNTKDSGPVVLDFSARRALAYQGLPGFGEGSDFSVAVDDATHSVTFERTANSGLRFVRTLHLSDAYDIEVEDSIINGSTNTVALPAAMLQTGPMYRELGHRDSAGFVHLGVDTLSPGGEDVKHWGSKIAGLFKTDMEEKKLTALPLSIERSPREVPVDWISAKNKYFVQIVTPEDGGENCIISARRSSAPTEKMTPLEEVSAAIQLPAVDLAGGQTLTRKIQYYVGPMKYDELHAMSLHRVDVMELGMWRPVGKILLVIMNFIHDHVWPHNYGLAIILLTIIVRIVFWPITHKSTESMKRMASVQPLVAQIREKYKDNPQRVQQEIMALYKEHKINPVGGCLPMLIQIPIFIALFMVLRSAIELRYAPFLWIKDLSEPENLFVDVVGFPINLLPLFMAGTMFLQQKLTPTTGDPAQAKMMRIMMPGMMLFMLYSYASGLALYWTTQNVSMILQQLVMQKRQKKT